DCRSALRRQAAFPLRSLAYGGRNVQFYSPTMDNIWLLRLRYAPCPSASLFIAKIFQRFTAYPYLFFIQRLKKRGFLL
ncbi:MAG: hypothetical protein LUG55_11765, partial [Clostridiales bacterium]|nr:hypothetical protein [Clostridiales bacterium]